MKTFNFTDDEIETLCRGLLALTDQTNEDFTPAILLHAKLVGPAPRCRFTVQAEAELAEPVRPDDDTWGRCRDTAPQVAEGGKFLTVSYRSRDTIGSL